jgi:hypothetical protein
MLSCTTSVSDTSDVVAKYPNIHPQTEYREGGRDRCAEKESKLRNRDINTTTYT